MLKILTLSALVACSCISANAQVAPAPVDTAVKVHTKHRSTGKVGLALSLNLAGGLAVASGGTPDLSRMGYPSMAAGQVSAYDYNSTGGINIGFDLDLLFGRKQNFGISTGLTYINSYGHGEAVDFHTEYLAHDANGNAFRRLLSSPRVNESFSFSNLSVPILFKYRTKPGEKIGAYIEIGPVISLLSSAGSSMDATVDLEAVYHYNTTTRNFIYSSTTSPGDWIMTRQAVAALIKGSDTYSSVDDYFAKHYARGYYIGLGLSAKGQSDRVNYNIGIGGMLRGGGIYRVNKSWSVLFGVSALLISNSHTVQSYTPVSTGDDYKDGFKFSSFLNGTPSLLTVQMGLHAGIQFKLSK
jgi:hypothetical protein